MTRKVGRRSKPIHSKRPSTISRKGSPLTREVLASALDCVIAMDHEGKITEFNAAAEKTFGYSRAEAIGKELARLIIPPSQREAHRRGLAHYRATREGPLLNKRIELTAKRADNTEFPVELTVVKIGHRWPPRFVGFVRDITERKRSEEEVQRHRQRAAALHEINLAVTSSLDLKTVLDLLLRKIDLLLPYAVITVNLLNKKTGELERTACRNLDENEWLATPSKLGRGLAAAVLKTKQPLLVLDAPLDPRTANPEFMRKHGLVSCLSFPLTVKSEILGVIAFCTRAKHHFSDEEIEFLTTLAGQAAMAIHNSQLYENAEKQRIALEKSEERFRIIAQATNDAIWDWTLDNNNGVWWNEGVARLFGYSNGEVGPDISWWYDHIHSEDRERVISGIHAVIGSGGQFWSDEYRYQRSDGSFAHVFDRGYVLHDESGKALRMIGSMVDITDRKDAEEKLSTSEKRLRTILDSEPECVKVVARDGTILETNPAGLAMIEADSPDQVVGKPVLQLIPSEHRPAVEGLIEAVFRGEKGILEFEIVGLKGTRRWLETHAVPLRDEKGDIPALLSITRDITGRKRLGRELLEISEREQRRIGQDLHDGLGQHLAGLAALMKGVEQKLMAKSAPEAADVARLTGLINQAITQTRSLARGLYPVELEANGLMAALEELALNTAIVFRISCLFQCKESILIQDNSVATHLYRIAQGAVDNAVKHAHPTEILIRLLAVDDTTVLSVSNDGISYPRTVLATPGMGLKIMRHRADLIKGSLEISRGKEGGTVVTCSVQTTTASSEESRL